MSVTIHFLPDDITIKAEAGEPMLQAAHRAGVSIPTGCLMGSCHACEVELDDGTAICACISSVPNKQNITVNLYNDPSW
jgi:ferredoxin